MCLCQADLLFCCLHPTTAILVLHWPRLSHLLLYGSSKQSSWESLTFLINKGNLCTVWMWELDHKEGWVSKNWCFWTVVLEKTPERPLDSKEIKPVNPKGNQPWTPIGKTEAPVLWPRGLDAKSSDAKSQLIGKDPNARKDRRQEKGATEDEMVGWQHRLSGHEFEQTLGHSEGQGSLACCSPWSHKESDTT